MFRLNLWVIFAIKRQNIAALRMNLIVVFPVSVTKFDFPNGNTVLDVIFRAGKHNILSQQLCMCQCGTLGFF